MAVFLDLRLWGLLTLAFLAVIAIAVAYRL